MSLLMFMSCLPRPSVQDPNYEGYTGSLSGTYTISTFNQDSSIDPSITGLLRKYCYDNGIGNMPILVIMHGWSGNATSFDENTYRRLASYGFFVIAPSIRSSSDASARELHDIIDAVDYVKTNFSSIVNPNRIAIAGYSGGGGNTLGVYAKFPDYFNLFVDHFGMSDYGYTPSGWHNTNPSYSGSIETRIGGTPVALPNEYRSRNMRQSINNFDLLAPLLIFHDTEDSSVDVVQSQEIESLVSSDQLIYRESTIGESERWTHGYPTNGSDVSDSEEYWKNLLFTSAPVEAPDSAVIIVSGYIVTKKFSIWLGNGTASEDGRNRSATVDYDLSTDSFTVAPLLEIGATDMTVKIVTNDGKVADQTISSETEIIVVAP